MDRRGTEESDYGGKYSEKKNNLTEKKGEEIGGL